MIKQVGMNRCFPICSSARLTRAVPCNKRAFPIPTPLPFAVPSTCLFFHGPCHKRYTLCTPIYLLTSSAAKLKGLFSISGLLGLSGNAKRSSPSTSPSAVPASTAPMLATLLAVAGVPVLAVKGARSGTAATYGTGAALPWPIC